MKATSCSKPARNVTKSPHRRSAVPQRNIATVSPRLPVRHQSALKTTTRKAFAHSTTPKSAGSPSSSSSDESPQTSSSDNQQSTRRGDGVANRLRSNHIAGTQIFRHSSVEGAAANPCENVIPPDHLQTPVPRLVSGLRDVIKHDGPVTIGPMDADTPYIEPKSIMRYIPQPDDINWDAIPPFITSSRDPALLELAEDHKVRFMGSTSSVGPLLSQLHFAITSHAPINVSSLSHWFASAATQHTRASVKPSVSLFRKRNNRVWGVDNPPSCDPKQNQILIDLGKSLERHLTFEWDDFKRIFVRQYSPEGELLPQQYTEEEVQESEAHAFLANRDLLLRSQLDCEDSFVPSPLKVFDLKTRATLPIRLDVMNHKDYLDYRITSRHGLYNSFEREFYDMGRSAFLKYAFQCRIGNMGGVFVAYHNTQELFGFEYIPLAKMDQMVYGTTEKAQFVFKNSLQLLQVITDRVIKDFAGKDRTADTLRVTAQGLPNKLVLFVERFPHVDLDDPVAVDAALACPFRGHVYVDWMNEEQARSALERRGLDTSGSRAHLISRLESASCTPSILYEPPTPETIESLMRTGDFKMYNLHLNLSTIDTQSSIEWNQITDGLDNIDLKYSFREIKMSGREPALAKVFWRMLLESALVDRPVHSSSVTLPDDIQERIEKEFYADPSVKAMSPEEQQKALMMRINEAKSEYLNEVVDTIDISKTQVPLTRSDQIRLTMKKGSMNSLMSQVNQYQQLQNGSLNDESRSSLEQKLKEAARPKVHYNSSHRRSI